MITRNLTAHQAASREPALLSASQAAQAPDDAGQRDRLSDNAPPRTHQAIAFGRKNTRRNTRQTPTHETPIRIAVNGQALHLTLNTQLKRADTTAVTSVRPSRAPAATHSTLHRNAQPNHI